MPSQKKSPMARWRGEAEKLTADQVKINVPFHVLLGESADVARFHDKYYASVAGRPGLDTVTDEKRGLTEKTGEDLLSLREATQQASTDYVLVLSPGTAAPLERAAFVVNESSATLEGLFDDGVENENDAQLASVKDAHAATPESHDAWAAELDDWAGLAAKHRKAMLGVGGFDASLIDEAVRLAAELRDRPATPAAQPENVAQAKALRDRLAALLYRRMQTVRGAARFVFRNQPAIIREATSTYERRRRAAARRAKLSEEKTGPDK